MSEETPVVQETLHFDPDSGAIVRKLAEVGTAIADSAYTPAGVILTWNLGAEAMFGYSAEEITGRKVPFAIGPLTAGNRLAVHPMEGCDGTLDGAPDDLTFRRWARFGGGGAKLLWGEAVAIESEGERPPPSRSSV